MIQEIQRSPDTIKAAAILVQLVSALIETHSMWQLARITSNELLRSVDGKILRINNIWRAGWLQINKKFHMDGTRTLPRQSTRTKAPQPIFLNVVIIFCRGTVHYFDSTATRTEPRQGCHLPYLFFRAHGRNNFTIK